jgi:hypothetical protein
MAMHLVAWSENHGNNDIRDYWIVVDTREEADAEAAKLQKLNKLHCWAVAPIVSGSDPDWTE